MRSRKRWVGVAALCMVAVVPEAHAQIVAPAGTPPAANLPADLSAQGVAAAPSAVTVRAQAAVRRAAKLEALSASASLAQAAARSVAAGALPAGHAPAAHSPAAHSPARAQVAAVSSVGASSASSAHVVGSPAQALALTRATRLDAMSGLVSEVNAAAHAMAAGFGTATPAGMSAGTTSAGTTGAGTTSAGSLPVALSPHAAWSLQAFTLPQRVGTPAAAAGVTSGVVVRHPAQNFGSGYLASYAALNHLTSSARGFRAAAAAADGCLVIGDSIGARTAPELDALARQEFGTGCAYEVWNGRPTEGAVNALEEIATTHGLPRRVVMISGANDIFNPPAFRAQVERAAAIVGPQRTLTWASVFVRRPLTGTAAADLENSRWLNILLSRVVARHENIHVVNWYGFLAARQRRLSTYLLDGVHPTTLGRRALAQLIADRW